MRARIGDVARVADRRLDDAAGLLRRLDRDLHVVDVVERVEDPEHVHAGGGRLLDERRARRRRGSWCSRPRWRRAPASGTSRSGPAGAAPPAAPRDPPTGTGRRRRRSRRPTSPARTGRRRGARSPARRARGRSVRSARRQQRLVRVAPGGVGEPHARIACAASSRCRPGPPSRAPAWCPGGGACRGTGGGAGSTRQHRHRRLRLAAHGRVAVDDRRPDVAQDARRAIAARRVLHQLRRLVDERRVRLARRERRVRRARSRGTRGWSSRRGCGTRAASGPPCAGRSSTRGPLAVIFASSES